jgi:glycosyltransferase involved in cell wall biosynthesis
MPATFTLPITLVVIARNEASVIGRCLDSVPFAAEKLVIDAGSTDGTREVARNTVRVS